jgi:hypothetical protein
VNVTRFKRAIEIIEALPDEQLNLKVWQQSFDKAGGYISSNQQATCGTIACAAGWLALNPEMQEQGLSSGFGGQPEFWGEDFRALSFRALELFFDIRDVDADSLFQSRTVYESCGDRVEFTDKQIWLQRAKHYLSAYEGTV